MGDGITSFPAAEWLFAWSAGVALLLGPILIMNFVSAVRSLRRSGIPRPYFVIVRRVLRLLPFPVVRLPPMERRLVFLVWDRRWMDHGETTARVIGANLITREIELELDRQIPPAQHRVTFTPRRKSRATYGLTSVIGTLSPAIDGVIPTAEVVVYPA